MAPLVPVGLALEEVVAQRVGACPLPSDRPAPDKPAPYAAPEPGPAAALGWWRLRLLLVGALLALLAGLVAEMVHASRLERALVEERRTATTARMALREESQAAQLRTAALESELGAAEDEAAQLYEVVRAMRALGEQLRVRVGLQGPVIEPLPDLPPRLVRPSIDAGMEAPDLPQGDGAPRAGAAPILPIVAVPVDVTANGVAPAGTRMGALPPNTGPWLELTPGSAPPPAAGHSPRIAVASQAITRHWELWQQLGQTIDATLNQRSRATRPAMHPAWGPITSGFGRRAGFWGVLAFHTGVDISLNVGTPVVVTANGTVSYAGLRPGYGVTVEIQHADGLLTLYGHLSRSMVSAGQQVSQGQVIALSGNSGVSTGPHLHYEIRLNGTPVDPTRYW